MTNTHTWSITGMDCYPQQASLTDVVFAIRWTLSGTDGSNTAEEHGSLNVALDPTRPFVPFSQLTEDKVIEWVQSELGTNQVAWYQGLVDLQLSALATPEIVSPALPWTPT